MYEFARGPLVWIAFIVFVGGSLYKLVSTFLLARKEKTVIPTMSARFGVRSLFHWVVPFRAGITAAPGIDVVSYAFHLCLW
jgi:hypothetical protein